MRRCFGRLVERRCIEQRKAIIPFPARYNCLPLPVDDEHRLNSGSETSRVIAFDKFRPVDGRENVLLVQLAYDTTTS